MLIRYRPTTKGSWDILIGGVSTGRVERRGTGAAWLVLTRPVKPIALDALNSFVADLNGRR